MLAINFHRTAVVLLLVGTLAKAQDPTSSDRETIQQLVEQIKDLQARVRTLESRQCTSTLSAGPVIPSPQAESPHAETEVWTQPAGKPQSPAPATAETAEDDLHLPEPLQMHEFHNLRWQGFGDVDYLVLNQKDSGLGPGGFVAGSAGNFYLNDFDLLLTASLNEKAHVLSEIEFGEEDHQSFDIELQRVLFEYDLNDYLKMSFGRYHTAVGYYNTAFLSGTWQETAADRPLIVEYASDGGPLPTQAVGVSVTGLVPSGKLGLRYAFQYGSSDTWRPLLNGIGKEDENNGNAATVAFFARPGSWPGLQIGGSVYHDRISDLARGPDVRVGQTIANVHGIYASHGYELLNEGFLIRHAYERSPLTYNMPGFYSQVSRRFGPVRPYFRYQYINANPGSLFGDISLRREASVGVRYDFDENFAFKAQMDHTARKGQPDLNALHLQLAFTF